MSLLLQPIVKAMRSHLQAASGAVLRHDADVGGVDAGADEPGQMVELDVSHLKKQAQHRCEAEPVVKSTRRCASIQCIATTKGH